MLQFVSSNTNKAKELQNVLQTPLELCPLLLPEIQTDDLEELVGYKARTAYDACAKPLIVEDTSLYFDAWGNLPGPLIKWFLRNLSLEQLVQAVAVGGNLRARAVCVIGLTQDGEEVHQFRGVVAGELQQPRGQAGFGWDAIFQPEGSTHTFAEMTAAEKQRYSMRTLAAQALKDFLAPVATQS
jgi:non-canonical purine NTP pyrophosphatase (RdgB/HAM1 family)